MSLIDDALKRAQAAHQKVPPGGAGSDGKVPWTPPPLPDRSRQTRARLGRILGFALLGALAAAVAIVVLVRSRRPAAAPSPASAAVRDASAAAGLPPITSEVTVAPPPAGVAARPSADAASKAPPPPQVRRAEGRRPGAEAPAQRPPDERGAERLGPTGPAGAQPQRPPRAAAERDSFAGELPLAGGGKITLDGIVYSESNPVAVLNGRITPPGGYVEGYTVTKIFPDKVELEREGKTVSITVR